MEDLDDDFGDLYADVEVRATSAIHSIPNITNLHIEKSEINPTNDDNGEKVFNQESKGVDLIGDDMNVVTTIANSEANAVEEFTDNNGSDSEDELNIVLNVDDEGGGDAEPGFVGMRNDVRLSNGGFKEEGEEEGHGGSGIGVEGSGLGKHRKWSDQSLVGDGLEKGWNDIERENGGKGGYHLQYSQYKYKRPQPAAFPNNSKGSEAAGVASYSSTFCRGEWDDNGCNQRMASNFVAAQSGHKNFSLPRCRTILDVNIDALERKPWRHPGVDITDFFNFGFDEDSWKHYCNRLDQHRQDTNRPKRIHPTEYSQPNKPKGRAIQVEERSSERQSSMDVMRSLDRDSDVVIQIRVQDTKEDSSGLAREGLGCVNKSEHQASETGDFDVDEEGDILCVNSASEDEGPGEYLEGNGEGLSTSVPKRGPQQARPSNSMCKDSDNHERVQISDDGHSHLEVVICESEATAETMETSNNTNKRVGRKKCNTVPSIAGTQFSNGEHSPHSPSSSCSGSHSESFRSGTFIDPGKAHNHVRRQLSNSVSEIQESVASDYYQSKDSKSHGLKAEAGNCRYSTRNRRSIQENVRHHSRRFHGLSGWKNHPDDDASPFSETEGWVDDSRQKKRLHRFDSFDGKDISSCKESELSFSYCGEQFSDYQAGAVYTRNPLWKGHQRFGYEADRDPSRNFDRGEYLFEQRISREDDEMLKRDSYHHERGLPVEDMDPPSCKSRWWSPKNAFHLKNERGTRWQRKGDEPQFRKTMRNDDFILDCEYNDDFMQEEYIGSVPYTHRERDYSEHKYERCLPHTRREVESPKRSRRRYDNSSIGLDNLWSMSEEDEYWRCTDHRSLASCSYEEAHIANGKTWHDTLSPRNDVYERDGIHGRDRREGSDSSWFGSYADAFDIEESFNNPDNQVHLRRSGHYWHSEVRHWAEDEYISRHRNGKFGPEGVSFSFKRISTHEHLDAKHGSDHARKLIDNRRVERARYQPIREGNSGIRFGRRSNIIGRGNHEKTLLRFGVSIDSHLVVREEKVKLGKPRSRPCITVNVFRSAPHMLGEFLCFCYWHLIACFF
ncbi:unnamed protein product [Ilex paraguariensis]|uniref:Pre-mRNA polyadenylation factor Fip1 domain-containing protein n=1 Tax=Ilex paraguariensis TaxID=185542 RepID=A0ABC8RMA0_9AQUA